MVGEESESGSKENLPSSIFYFIRIMLKNCGQIVNSKLSASLYLLENPEPRKMQELMPELTLWKLGRASYSKAIASTNLP